jgi:hypothetical protein
MYTPGRHRRGRGRRRRRGGGRFSRAQRGGGGQGRNLESERSAFASIFQVKRLGILPMTHHMKHKGRTFMRFAFLDPYPGIGHTGTKNPRLRSQLRYQLRAQIQAALAAVAASTNTCRALVRYLKRPEFSSERLKRSHTGVTPLWFWLFPELPVELQLII